MRNRNAFTLIALSFILGSSLTLFFIAVDDSKTSNSAYSFSKFGYGVSYENITNKYFLLIIIITSPDNFIKRNTIRETWLQLVKHDESVKHLFVIGTGDLSYEKEKLLTDEYAKHGDILSLNTVRDSYKTLTKKVLTSLVIVDKEYSFKFILKCDDDSFVQISNIVKELKSQFHDKKFLYWGFFNGRATVKRVGKWKEANWFLCDRYLPYALGGGYILSHQLVKYISRNADLFR